jgi:uncharacterized protein (DUF2252 family)
VPFEEHAVWEPTSERDPIVHLEHQAAERDPSLIGIRHHRMAASPFAYYRGAALSMAWDLSTTPATGITTQICADAHLSNFGLFGSPERHLYFDLNDFDETAPGPWEWDIKRLAASIELAGRGNGFADKERKAAVRGSIAAYREAMASFAGRSLLTVWYQHLDMDDLLPEFASALDEMATPAIWKAIERSRSHDHAQAFAKLSIVVDGEPRIVADPPLIVPIEDMAEGVVPLDRIRGFLETSFENYIASLDPDRRHLLRGYRLADFARKVVGVGSVGTQAWIALLVDKATGDPLFLQIKEAQASVVEAPLGDAGFGQHGERVVVGQRAMQSASDIMLGWFRNEVPFQHDYYVRQLRDWKGSAEIERMTPAGMRLFGRMAGWTLARAHAKTGDRSAIASYLGDKTGFDKAIAAFSIAYADQTERDHAAVVDAIASGRLEATPG